MHIVTGVFEQSNKLSRSFTTLSERTVHVNMSIYDLLGEEGYERLYAHHLASAEADVAYWHDCLQRLNLPITGQLLDIGCGLGERTAVWAKYGYNVVGVDKSKPMLETARRKFPYISFLELDACDCSRLGLFNIAAAHFNFLMMMPMLDILTLLQCLRIVIPSGGAFITDVSLPKEEVPSFSQKWSFNGRDLTEIGDPLEDGYQHEWLDANGKTLCRERFWFRTRKHYQRLATSSDWNIRFLNWKTDESCKHDLMIFT